MTRNAKRMHKLVIFIIAPTNKSFSKFQCILLILQRKMPYIVNAFPKNRHKTKILRSFSIDS